MATPMKIIDLTHTLSGDIPTWDGSCGFELVIAKDYKDFTAPDLFRVQKITCGAGSGTHMDAPAHVVPGGVTIDQLDVNGLFSDCVVIDVSAQANENYIIVPMVIDEFEKEHGRIQSGSFVIFYTGWDKHWENKGKYRNGFLFPSVHVSTAEMLLQRDISGIGTDTLSCDRGDQGFPVHQAILGASKYLVENIANARELPPIGAKILVLPLKIREGAEAPVRLVALWEP
jgi:kynurenine formamidase